MVGIKRYGLLSGWFSLVLSDDGGVYSFGDNMVGQCGHGSDTNEVPLPTPISALRSHEVLFFELSVLIHVRLNITTESCA